MKTIAKFFCQCTPPTTTAQQQGYRRYKTLKKKYAEAFWESVLRQYAPDKPATNAVILEITISHPLTKAQVKQGISVAPKLSRPDCDNYAKLILDAMTKTQYFNDDKQVYDLRIIKYHAAFPGIAVTLKEQS
jgi:Holliday junction resolvase RusA-like endonuclease